MKRRLLLLVDSPRYIKANCYQSQLLATLKSVYRVDMVSADAIALGRLDGLENADRVLSVLRLRTLQRLAPILAPQLASAPVWIYEQDPWQAYMDGSPFKGSYEQIAAALNVASFLNTSRWWSDHVKAHGLPSIFVRMGMLPKYCCIGKPWEKRKVALGFQGTVHPHRKIFFDALAGMGVSVSVFPSQSYRAYLKTLHDIRIYIHTEDDPWCLEGAWTPRNALWIKDTEVAARGCFAIRDHEGESAAYDIAELPTIFTYRQVTEVPEIIASIQAMPAQERAERMSRSVERMRQRNDWMTVVDAIEGRRR